MIRISCDLGSWRDSFLEWRDEIDSTTQETVDSFYADLLRNLETSTTLHVSCIPETIDELYAIADPLFVNKPEIDYSEVDGTTIDEIQSIIDKWKGRDR